MNSTSSSIDNPVSVGEFNELLLPVIAAGLSSGAIHRVEFDIENGENFSPRWLDAATLYPKIFWRSRSGGSPVAAMGAVAAGTLEELENILQCSDPGVRIFGGARFDGERIASEDWAGFAESRFFIPLAEIIRSGATTRLAINFINGQTHAPDVSHWLAAIAAEERAVNPSVLTRWDQPNFSTWAKNNDGRTSGFRGGGFSKVVLGRKSSMELAQAVSPFALTEILMAGAPACFHFCFQPSPDSGGFLGASPELLYRRIGRAIQSEAVAGTRPRSLDPSEDERLEFQLLEFSKEQLEHRLVVEALSDSFKKLCLDFSCDEKPSVLKLARVQHLRTALRGTLRKGVGDSAIIAMLHPTPATCGSPSPVARKFIATHEPFDRGWYAGLIGCVSGNESEFAVAIRSMHLRGKHLDVYAGAGIVPGSDPEREWSELEDKISGVLHILAS